MELNTAGATMATWAYGNISRFVKDAVTHDLDTVSLRSSGDAQTEDVWLPGCDRPSRSRARSRPWRSRFLGVRSRKARSSFCA